MTPTTQFHCLSSSSPTEKSQFSESATNSFTHTAATSTTTSTLVHAPRTSSSISSSSIFCRGNKIAWAVVGSLHCQALESTVVLHTYIHVRTVRETVLPWTRMHAARSEMLSWLNLKKESFWVHFKDSLVVLGTKVICPVNAENWPEN